MKRGMFLYPWDLRDEGAATVANRLTQLGIDNVALATSYHAGKFLRPHSPQGKVCYPEDGTVYFWPDVARYGRLKPQVATMAEDYDALSALAAAAPDLRRVGWTVGLHNSRLGKLHPDLVCRTAFGDPIWSSLCPAQADVQDYLIALCADLGSNTPLDEIRVEAPGYQTYRHNDHHEFELIDLPPRAMSLLGLCFCGACQSAAASAGLDAEALAEKARAELEAFFTDGNLAPSDLNEDPEWHAYLDTRCRVVTDLVASVRASIPAEVALSVIPTVRSPLNTCWREGADLARLAKVTDLVSIPIYRTIDDTVQEMAWARLSAGPEAALGFILRPGGPLLETPEALEQASEAARATGADTLDIYNYGHLRLNTLDWMRAP